MLEGAFAMALQYNNPKLKMSLEWYIFIEIKSWILHNRHFLNISIFSQTIVIINFVAVGVLNDFTYYYSSQISSMIAL